MRLIDANALEIAITTLIYEFECRAPKWSPNDMLTSAIDAAKKYGYKADGAEAALNIIRRMPTIDTEPMKHGTWRKGENFGGKFRDCSVCNVRHYNVSFWKYCPNCGAKMDGEAE